MLDYRLREKVEKFPGKNGWFYIPAGKSPDKKVFPVMHYGLIPIIASIGKTTWKTSLLPKGDKTLFIALPKHVRLKEKIELGDIVELNYKLRNNWR